jgi:small subunit ribosomal protein S13
MLDNMSKENLNPKKSLQMSLTGTKGLGVSIVNNICTAQGFQTTFKTGQLNSQMKTSLEKILLTVPTPTENRYSDFLKKTLTDLKQSGSYRGQRIAQALPVRGQRTKSNARTQKQKKPSSGQAQRTAFSKKKTRSSGITSNKNSRQNSAKISIEFPKSSKLRCSFRKI